MRHNTNTLMEGLFSERRAFNPKQHRGKIKNSRTKEECIFWFFMFRKHQSQKRKQTNNNKKNKLIAHKLKCIYLSMLPAKVSQ